MRIGLVCPFDPLPGGAGERAAAAHVGGVERVYAELAPRLAERGHDVTLISSSDAPGASREGGLARLRCRRRLTVLRAPVASLHRALPPDLDLVQVPATYPFTTAPVLRRAHAAGIPSVLDFHFEPSSGGLAGRLGAAAYRTGPARSYDLATAVVVRSRAYARTCPSLRGMPPWRWTVVPNGVDPRKFRPDLGVQPRDHILFVGRLVPYKGLDVLLRALQAYPVPLVVVGDGPLRGRLTRMARRLGVDAAFMGWVPDEDLPGLYRQARLTVLPSVNRQEAFGISLVESMACGTPVLASNLPGVADVARAGGRIFRRGDPAALARELRAMLEAASDGRLRRGPELAAAVHGRFGWDTVADRFEALHGRLAGRPSPSEVNLAHPLGQPVL